MPKRKAAKRSISPHHKAPAPHQKFNLFNLKIFGLHLTPMIIFLVGVVLILIQGVVFLVGVALVAVGGVGLITSAFKGLSKS